MRLSWVSSSFFIVLVSLGAQTTAPDLGRRGVAVDKPASIDRKISSSDVPRGFGLIIGIAEYGNLAPAMNLRYPERDADLMYNVLTSKEGGNFRPEDVRELIGPKATLKNVTEALETWLPSVARENDRVVIYFAGHGFLDEERKGYLAPYDVDPKRLKETAYSMDKLGRVVGKDIKARWKMLLADACHSGAITPEVIEQVNHSLQAVPDILVLTASRKRESSFEDKDLQHGVFTYYVAKALEGNADHDGNGVVTADEFVDYVRNNVHSHVEKRGEQQTPIENQDFDPGLILAFNSKKADEVSQQTLREGSLIVACNRDDVEVFVDGKRAGVTSTSKALPILGVAPGEHEVRGVKMGYEPDSQRIVVYPGRDTPVHLRIQFLRTPKKTSVDLVNRARALWQKGSEQDEREAVKLLNKALTDDPSYSEAALFLGRAYQVLYAGDDALKYLHKAVDLDPDWIEAQTALASALMEGGNTDEAILQLRHALERQPTETLLYSHISQAFYLAGAYDKGVEAAQQAIHFNTSNAQAYLWLGNCLRQQRKFEEAKKAYFECARLMNFDASFGRKLAWASGFVMITPINWKQRATQKAVYKDQKNLTYFGLCECEEKLGDLNQAAKHCNTALQYDPQDAYSYKLLAQISVRRYNDTSQRSSLEAARGYYEKMLAINHDSDDATDAQATLKQINTVLKRLGGS
jgi:tetratricopeptide (TPR) repeat protein